MPPPQPPLPSPRKTNWWMIGCSGCLGLILLGMLGMGALYFGVMKLIKSSDSYQIALDGALRSPEVQAELGTPITTGWMLQGNVNTNISNGVTHETANLTIPLKGLKASGSLHYAATRSGDKWDVTDYSVTIGGGKKTIHLSP